MTSVHEFDDFVRDGNIWVKAVMDRLGTDDAHAAYLVLRATLHALRDRIPAESAVHLGAQLPTIIRGTYFENWHMAHTPTKERHLAPFLDHVKKGIPVGLNVDVAQASRAVFEVMSDRIDHAEIAKVARMLPLELRDLWPVLVQVDAAKK